MLIILGGLPGTGKTTIARELARQLGAVHVRIDSIEQAIVGTGRLAGSLEDAGYRVGYALAEDNLRNNCDVIADSVNPIRVTRDAWAAVAERTSTPAIEVEVICSDAAEHRRRVQSRKADIPGHTLPDWGEVTGRQYERWHRSVVTIDTARSTVGESVEQVRQAIAERARRP